VYLKLNTLNTNNRYTVSYFCLPYYTTKVNAIYTADI